ncbi:MAG TPA: integrin alpha [Ignavibacteria bacterium]|nr:integrin alpha [Ignavibacteria bacterium]
MKNFTRLICLSAIIFLLNRSAEASRISSENELIHTPQIKNITHSNSNSLPAGVTKEWLRTLTDENGHKIIQSEDPEADAMQERFFTGYAASDQFGFSVSSAGDVNGDGYSDLIIGAPFNDAGGSNAGRAYIYFGGSNMNNTADVNFQEPLLTISSDIQFHQQVISTATDIGM